MAPLHPSSRTQAAATLPGRLRKLKSIAVSPPGLAYARLLMFCAVTTFGCCPAPAAERVALVIGNSDYINIPKLANSTADADAIAARLSSLAFDVILANNTRMDDLRAAVKEFRSRLQNSEVGLLYYAGHGVQLNGSNYIIPVDASLEEESDLNIDALSVDDIEQMMEELVPVRLLLLDACRNNPLAQSQWRSIRSGSGLAPDHPSVGTLIAYATAPGQVALDGLKHNSPFTAALVKHIATPGIEVRQMLSRVRAEVLKQTGGMQIPWDASSLVDDFYFLPSSLATEDEKDHSPAINSVVLPASDPHAEEENVADLAFKYAALLERGGQNQKATEWYLEAAKQGNERAQHLLGWTRSHQPYRIGESDDRPGKLMRRIGWKSWANQEIVLAPLETGLGAAQRRVSLQRRLSSGEGVPAAAFFRLQRPSSHETVACSEFGAPRLSPLHVWGSRAPAARPWRQPRLRLTRIFPSE